MSQPFRPSVRSPLSEAIDARFLRSMLYEPLPGSAAHILAQLGIIEQGHVEALGARTYDAEHGRLSLSLDDGRTVELERAMPLQSEDGYAVRIRSRAGQTISRSFIHIDRNLVVRNLHNDRTALIDDPYGEPTHRTYAPTYNQPMDTLVDVDLPPAQNMANVDEALDVALDVALDEEAPAEDPNPDLTLMELSAPEAEEQVRSVQAQADDPSVSPSEAKVEALDERDSQDQEPGSNPAHAELSAGTASQGLQPHAGGVPPDPLEEYSPIYFQETPQREPEALLESSLGEPASQPGTANDGAIPPAFHLEAQRESPDSAGFASPETAEVAAASEPGPEVARESMEHSEPVYFAEPEAAEEWLTLEPAQPLELTEPFFTEPEPEAEFDLISAVEPAPWDDYAPLVAAFGAETAADFCFIALTGTVHTYEHNETFRYIHLDAPSGLFYSQDRTPISATSALQYALTPRAASKQPQVELAASAPAHPSEPELRTRTSPAPRAAIRPDPDPSDLKPDQALTFDAFTRKHHLQQERDSWRNRIADLSRTLRLRRTQSPEKPLDEL